MELKISLVISSANAGMYSFENLASEDEGSNKMHG